MSISRPLAAGALMGIVLVIVGQPPLSHFIFIAAGASILMSMEAERPGYLHSVPSVLFMSLLALGLTAFFSLNILYGISVSAGLVSHILLDSMTSPLYIWKKGGEWFSAMPGKRWTKHGDAAVSLVCGIVLVIMVMMG